jgi:hypothetical protein
MLGHIYNSRIWSAGIRRDSFCDDKADAVADIYTAQIGPNIQSAGRSLLTVST